MEELVARVRARLSAPARAESRVVAWDDVAVDLDARAVSAAGAPVAVTKNELDLLAYLIERPGRAVSRAQLAEAVLSSGSEVDQRTVDSHISRVRRKLGDAGARIATVRGIGYRFDPPEGR
jgi:DNA-binding response OmpR family regulator